MNYCRRKLESERSRVHHRTGRKMKTVLLSPRNRERERERGPRLVIRRLEGRGGDPRAGAVGPVIPSMG